VSEPTAAKALSHLVTLGVLDEITGRPRNKVFVYRKSSISSRKAPSREVALAAPAVKKSTPLILAGQRDSECGAELRGHP